MHGNVEELCLDAYTSKQPTGINPFTEKGSGVVVRGGSYRRKFDECKASSRRKGSRTQKNRDVGFRLALVSDEVQGEHDLVEVQDDRPLFASQLSRDLLKNLDLSSSAIQGLWSKSADGVLSPSTRPAAILELPVEPNGPLRGPVQAFTKTRQVNLSHWFGAGRKAIHCCS